jgi:transcriptional regulator of heat shock response
MIHLMDPRQSNLLVAIIDEFLETALPVGSKKLLSSGDFLVSSATIRAEMNKLSDEGYLTQPHISAGRIPTAIGYRVYVKDYMKPTVHEKKVRQKFETLKQQYFQRKDMERAYEAVALLSHMIPNVAFATVPHKSRVYYLGLANALKQPEFQDNPLLASTVVEILEKDLSDLLAKLTIDTKVRYYIGEDHILPQFQSCSLMVKGFDMRGCSGVIGILGPMRMDYAYNTVALECVSDLLQENR